MSNWIAITKADLYNSKAAAIIDQADSEQLGAGQTDRSTGVIADVTLEIRRRVARCNQLDADTTTIPAGLKPLAVDIIYCRLKLALGIDLLQGERDALNRREQELQRVANGEDLVDPPDNAVAPNMNTATALPSFGTRGVDLPPRKFTDYTQDG